MCLCFELYTEGDVLIHVRYWKKKTEKWMEYMIKGDLEIQLCLKYKKMTESKHGNKGRVFWQVRGKGAKTKIHGQPLGIHWFTQFPKRMAQALGYENSNEFSGHTIPRSAATIMADSGASLPQIKSWGGWNSNSVPFSYIENSVPMKLAAAERLKNGGCRSKGGKEGDREVIKKIAEEGEAGESERKEKAEERRKQMGSINGNDENHDNDNGDNHPCTQSISFTTTLYDQDGNPVGTYLCAPNENPKLIKAKTNKKKREREKEESEDDWDFNDTDSDSNSEDCEKDLRTKPKLRKRRRKRHRKIYIFKNCNVNLD